MLYDTVQPYLEYIECKIFQLLDSYSRSFEHAFTRGLSRKCHAGTISVELAVVIILNYYRQVMSQYLWYCNIAQDRFQDDKEADGPAEIYALINNFESAMWENRLEPLLCRPQQGHATSKCNADSVQDNDSPASGSNTSTRHDKMLSDDRALLCVSPCDVDCCDETDEDLENLMEDSIDNESESKFIQYMKTQSNNILNGDHSDEDTEQHLAQLFGEDYTTSSFCSSDEVTRHENANNHVTSTKRTSSQDCQSSKRKKRKEVPKSVSFRKAAATKFFSIPRPFSVAETTIIANCISDNTALVETGQLSIDGALENVDKVVQHLLMRSLNGLPSMHEGVFNIGT